MKHIERLIIGVALIALVLGVIISVLGIMYLSGYIGKVILAILASMAIGYLVGAMFFPIDEE